MKNEKITSFDVRLFFKLIKNASCLNGYLPYTVELQSR